MTKFPYIYTDKLDSEDHFKINFDGPKELEYNETILSELGKSGCGRYDFANIKGGSFSIYATSSDKVIISYKYNEDGCPAIYIESESADSIDGDKPAASNTGETSVGVDNRGTSEVARREAKKDTNVTPSKSSETKKFEGWIYDSVGWWYQYADGTYAKNTWALISGKWYYFKEDGYMAYSEYIDGYWLGEDGAWDPAYSHGHWRGNDKIGWRYEDDGWRAKNRSLWIDGKEYHFNRRGRCTNPY